MGNIGDTISATIPAVGSAGTTYATNINLFLTEVKNRLEALVPRASLAAGDLDLDGDALQNADYVLLAAQSGAPTTPTGSLQRYNNDLYWINNAGAVQITSGSTLNTSLVGGITGDYGGANPAQFRFVDADQEYYAYDDYAGGAWARVWAKNFDIAAGATSSVRARLAFGGGSSVTYTLPSSAPVSTSYLTMDSSGNITTSGAVSTTVTLHAAISAPAANSFSTPHTFNGDDWTLGNNAAVPIYFPLSVPIGKTITGFTVGIIKNSDSTNTITASLFRRATGTGSGAVAGVSTATNNDNAPAAARTLSVTGQTHVVAADYAYAIHVLQSDSTPSAADNVVMATVTYQ